MYFPNKTPVKPRPFIQKDGFAGVCLCLKSEMCL